jgi:hypothetical protein
MGNAEYASRDKIMRKEWTWKILSILRVFPDPCPRIIFMVYSAIRIPHSAFSWVLDPAGCIMYKLYISSFLPPCGGEMERGEPFLSPFPRRDEG